MKEERLLGGGTVIQGCSASHRLCPCSGYRRGDECVIFHMVLFVK